MEKTNYTQINMKKGEMNIYNFGKVKLHAYKTNDLISDEVFIVEKDNKAVIIESPCFYDNIKELTDYIVENKLSVEGVLISYHASGATFLPNVKKYATKNADEYGHSGGGKALIDNFTKAFGDIFDNSIHETTNFIENGKQIIGGIEFDIVDKSEGFDIIIPEINAVYTHMLGHDCHSIVAGANHADVIINELKDYLKNGYDLILTSHYTPENLKDVKTKIAYLEDLKKIAKSVKSAEEFKSKVNEKYQNYSGGNYLDMTTSFFFQN